MRKMRINKKLKRCLCFFLISLICLNALGITATADDNLIDATSILNFDILDNEVYISSFKSDYKEVLDGATEIKMPEIYTENGLEYQCSSNRVTMLFYGNDYFTKVVFPINYNGTSMALFQNCTSVKEIIYEYYGNDFIISSFAFSNCTSLEKLYIYAESIKSDELNAMDAFTNVPSTATAYVKNETVKASLETLSWPGTIVVDPSMGGEEPTDPVNYTALDEAITAGEAVDTTKYTEDSVKALTDAIAAGKAVKENADATQDEVDAAAKAITDAIAALEELPAASSDVYLWTGTYSRSGGLDTTSITDNMTVTSSSGYITFKGIDLSNMLKPYIEVVYDANDSTDTLYVSTSSWSTVINSSSDEVTTASLENFASSTAFIVTTNNKSGTYGIIKSVKFYDAAYVAPTDYTELESAITEAEAIDTTNYTEDSVKALTDAIAAAKTVLANADAAQDEVDAAVQTLAAAIDALEELPTASSDVYLWTGTYSRSGGLDTTSITDNMTVTSSSGYITFKGIDLSNMLKPYIEVVFDANDSTDTLYVSTSSWSTVINSSSDEVTTASLENFASSTAFIVTTNNKSGTYGIIKSVKFYDAAVSQKTVVATYEIGAENASDVIAAIYDDGSMIISGTGAMTDYTNTTVPWRVDGNADNVKSVVVEEGVTNVSKYAFRGNTSIENVTLASTVTTIGNYAFYGCSNENLTVDIKGVSVTCNSGGFSSSVVGTIYVYDSTTFTNVSSKATKANVVFLGELPVSGKAGENATYTYDKDTRTLTISGTGTISEDLSLFSGSTEKLIIEDGLTSVSTSAGINKFTNAVIIAPTSGTFNSDNSNWSYDAETKTLTLTKNKSTSLSSDTTSLMNLYKGQAENIVISGNFSRITSSAIADYTALKTLTIPSSVSTIDSNGIKNCGDENTVIYIDADYKISINSSAFSGTKGTLSVLSTSILNSILQLDLSNKIVYRGEKLTSGNAGNMISWTWDDATKTLTFSGTGKMYDSNNYLEKLTYYGLYINEAENVIIGEGIEDLTGIAFKNYKALKSVSIPSTVTSLGQYSFSGCSNESLTIDIKSSSSCSAYSRTTFANFVGTVNVYDETVYNYFNALEPFKSGTAKVVLKEPEIIDPTEPTEPSTDVYTWTGNWTKQTGLVDAGTASGITVANTGGGWQMLISDVDISLMVEPVIVVTSDATNIQVWYGGTSVSSANSITQFAKSGEAVSLENYKSETKFTLSGSDTVCSITSIRIYDMAYNRELDYTALNQMISNAEAIDTDNYTSYSIAVLNSAVESAKAILADENATQEAIDIAVENINDAIAALKDKSFEANYIVKVEKSGVEAVLDTFKADDSTAGAVKVKITFDCAEDVNFNKYANIEVKAVVNGTESYQIISGTGEESEAVKGEQGIEIELPLTNAIASGNDVKLSAFTWCFSNAVDYVYGITKVEYINENGEVVRTITNSTISLEELKSAIAEGEAVDSSLYTADSYAVLTSAIGMAKAVLANAEATQEDIDAAAKAITDAIAALEEKPIVVTTGTVTGTIKVSDSNAETEMTVTAVSADGTETSVTATSMGTYALEDLEAGEYTLTISGGKYAPRSYEITVTEGEIAQDVELNPYGDINGDGNVTTADVGMANSHAKGVQSLEGYKFVCADVKIDGSITTADVGMINSHAKSVSTLW